MASTTDLDLDLHSAPMDIPAETACSSSLTTATTTFHTPVTCSCSPSCSFHAPFSSLDDGSCDDHDAPLDDDGDDRAHMSIEEVLPAEVLQHVLGFVPLGQLAGDVARTSRLWRSLALDPILWLPHWRGIHFARPRVELPELTRECGALRTKESDVRRGVQPPPEGEWGDERGSGNDPWLMDAGRSLQQALDEGHPVDWRREFLRRKSLSVLVVTYHTSHSNHYDMDTIRQLKKFGIQADICHLMCGHDHKAPDVTDGYYKYVEYDDNLFMKYDTIIYFAAMSGGEAMKKTLGDSLMAFLRSGGGIIFCIYTHMKARPRPPFVLRRDHFVLIISLTRYRAHTTQSYQLLGKWTESFYPIKPANRLQFTANSPTKREKNSHPVMSGVRRTQIDTTRLGSRAMGCIDPLAKVVGEFDDGVPLVVVLDGEANSIKAREEEKKEEDQQASSAGNDVNGQEEKGEEETTKTNGVEEEWGKTVFLNFFPVSKDDPCTGGWYDWNSDIPLLLRNAVLFAARRGPRSSFPH